MNVKNLINHLCDRYGARSTDLTPWTRVWTTRSGNTYCIKHEGIFHRYPDGRKCNYFGSDGLTFIDGMEGQHG